jgi:poly(hydroxyalkanoate) granule-associated protein
MAKTLKDTDRGKNPMAMLFKGIAHQAWLAGLGIISMAQQEAGKLFESLITEGERVEAQSKALEIKDQGRAEKSKDPQYIENLQKIFDDRVYRSLQRLDVPTREDMQYVFKQMEELNKNIKTLTQKTRQKI